MPHKVQVANPPTNLLLTRVFSLPQRAPSGYAPETHEPPYREASYLRYIIDFMHFHGKRHPREPGVGEIRAQLSYLAAEKDVAASTQRT